MDPTVEEMKKYINFLETVLNHISEAVYIGGADGKTVFINREAERLDRLSREYVIGRTEEELYGTRNGKLVTETGQPIIDERTSYRTEDGRLKYILHSVFPFYYKNEICGNFAISRDITREDKYIAKIYELQQELKAENRRENKNGTRYIIDNIIGKSVSMITALTMAERAGKFGTNVLICGETGTGKEMFAQSIHNCGVHRNEPFVGINCGAIPENLLESTLFGTSKGAFTGAMDSPGLFESAKNGTLFLDEIDSMSLSMQAKLLRVLQEKSVRRIGGKNEIPVTCRVISATNTNIEDAVEAKKIRMDLYYRLSSVVLQIPPLRERRRDVLLLAEEFVRRFQDIFNTGIEGLSQEVKDVFLSYQWPGNV
ncbi:MAG: sigma 54-interacting transcriptional regulator, partial [Bacillota bacterium]|nr:sigma 54-interacting transcriptional regulator [Bacillota bacterium]